MTTVNFAGKSMCSVVICAFTLERWDDLTRAVEGVGDQSHPPAETLVVIDHNPQLLQRARDRFVEVRVVPNHFSRGLSGSRNTGLELADSRIVVFLDDDAVPAPDWLHRLTAPFGDERVMAVGGRVEAAFDGERPRWFPPEFDWVVGCSYRGLPTEPAVIRNPIGANMAFRSCAFDGVGGFNVDLGRVGGKPAGCEETELSIRINQRHPGSILYEPGAVVRHRVPQARSTPGYFARRCFSEGQSKAVVALQVGSKALSCERRHVLSTLPAAVVRGCTDAAGRTDPFGIARTLAVTAGFGATVAGYLFGFSKRRYSAGVAASPNGWSPERVVRVDLDEPVGGLERATARSGEAYGCAQVLACAQGRPLDLVPIALEEGGIAGDRLERELWERSGLSRATSVSRVSPPRPTAAMSVVVATRGRPDRLRRCLQSLLALDYPSFEVLVVDNAPPDDRTRRLVDQVFPGVRYVREDRPGASAARNRGIEEANHPLIAFCDDDVVVDPRWLTFLAARFDKHPRPAAVTGLVLPMCLDTRPQAWFEQYGGFNKGYLPRVFDMASNRPANALFPFTPGMFGSGNNVAFRAADLRRAGGYDEALGPGMPTGAGEDLDLFLRLVLAGESLCYEPAAVVYHDHRDTYAELANQLQSYGRGLTALLTKSALQHPGHARLILARLPQGIAEVFRPGSRKNSRRKRDFPYRLIARELLGMVEGPLAYARARRLVRPAQP